MANPARWAITGLSRAKKSSAQNDEILIEKSTGQVLYKTLSGDIISYDGINRVRNHISNLTTFSQFNGISGTVNTVEFDNLELPSVITENVNLMPTALTVKTGSPKRFLFSLDVDTVETSDSSKIGQEPTVTIIFTLTGATTVTQTITGTVSEIGQKVLNAADYFAAGTNLSAYNLNITSIRITKASKYTSQTLKHILHSMLIVVE